VKGQSKPEHEVRSQQEQKSKSGVKEVKVSHN